MSTATHRRRAHAAARVNDQHTSDSFDDDDRAMQIAAAQLRLVTDRRLGKTTPEWVQQLAKEEPAQDS